MHDMDIFLVPVRENFCLTFSAADVFSSWLELRPILNETHKWVFQAMTDIKLTLSFPLLGIDSDNGQEVHDAVAVLMSLNRARKPVGGKALAISALHAV